MIKIGSSLKNLYLSEVKTDLISTSKYSKNIITEKDILTLPKPVQRYIRYCGYLDKEKMVNAKTEWKDIDFKTAQNKKWIRIGCLQYNSVSKPTRIVYLQSKILGVFPFEARDKYQGGKGNMLIKLLKLFTIADAKGVEMDKSGLVTVLAEMSIIPTYALQSYVKWETIDDYNAKATLTYNNIKVSGTFSFSDKGEMKSFYTENRYFAEKDGTFKNIPWSIKIDNYIERNGLKIPNKLKAMWHLNEGDFEYFKGNISNIEYNVME